ncbi:putative protein OS=Lysinibacillus sphaericus OX=1421 GN=LS41612_04745 PE=4 SV=1 [Lysinibacillus sphaericus]
MKPRKLPFMDTSHFEEDGYLKTVEEVVRIINKFESGYGISDEFIIEGINRGEISVRPILDEATFANTKYDVLIPNYVIFYLLVDRYHLNEFCPFVIGRIR